MSSTFRLVPFILSEHHKKQHMCLSLQYLLYCRDDGDDFLQHIVAVGETWCYHFQPEVKSNSMQWKHPDSPRPEKFKAQQSTRKVMLMAFFDLQRPLLLELDFFINVQWYTQILDKLHKAIKNKPPGMLSSGVILLYDNTRLHVTKVCIEALACKNWKVREHPAYSQDLSPCDCDIFGPLKKNLMGQRFYFEDNVKAAALNWFHIVLR
ncbi:transposase [Trichonephila clavipes]|nr:transposase [Trichonephila clavipes]